MVSAILALAQATLLRLRSSRARFHFVTKFGHGRLTREEVDNPVAPDVSAGIACPLRQTSLGGCLAGTVPGAAEAIDQRGSGESR